MKFWTPTRILKENAHYNIVFGERSNGKSYGVCKHFIEDYIQYNKKFAYIRRWEEDIKGFRLEKVFEGINRDKIVYDLTKGAWDCVIAYRRQFYLGKYIETEKGIETVRGETPIGYAYALTDMEHDKGETDSEICNILFDECMTRKMYLPDEFIIFLNTLSTIIRLRDNVQIFMLGNTVNKYCPYFTEMGLTNVKNMKRGQLEVYKYGNSELKVAVEFADTVSKKKPSNVYFSFDNPKLEMITGATGNVWEMNIYPHLSVKYTPNEIQFIYFIIFDGRTMQCEIINTKNGLTFTFIHDKTTPIKDPEKALIYSLESAPGLNYRRDLSRPVFEFEKKLLWYFKNDKVFYQSNDIGETVRNYFKNCKGSVLD